MELLREHLWNLQSLLYAALVAKLLWTGLWRQYSWFTALMCCQTAQLLGLRLVPEHTRFYFWAYIVSQSAIWILTIFVVQEIYSLVFSRYPGLETWGRRILMGSACLSIGVAFLLLWTSQLKADSGWEWQLQALLSIEQALALSLAFFLLLLAVCLVCLPIPLPRGIVAHCAVYFAYFLGVSLSLLYLHDSAPVQRVWGNLVLLSFPSVCLTAWLILLRPTGNQEAISLARQWNSKEERFLLDQLNSLNHTLMKSLHRRES